MDKVDSIVKEFCDNVDNEMSLQKNLNDFSKNVTKSLLKQINTDEAVLASFGADKKFAFKVNAYKAANNQTIYKISVADMEKFRSYFKLGALDNLKTKTATFEYDDRYNLEEEMSNALTLLLFDIFGIEVRAQNLGDDGLVRM